MNRPHDSDAFEVCRKHIFHLAPSLLERMEELVKQHPLLSGDIIFYSAMERMLIHAPPHYLPIIRLFRPDELRMDGMHDIDRAKFFCFRSGECKLPEGFLQQEYRTLRARLDNPEAQSNKRRITSYKAVCIFYMELCIYLWQRVRRDGGVRPITPACRRWPSAQEGQNAVECIRRRVHLLKNENDPKES